MSWKTIIISNPCRLSSKDNNLVISRYEQDDVKIPINDLSSIVIETTQCTITSSLLSKLSTEGVAVYVCDDTHMPNGLLAPFGTHSR
ncbi:CRISPR-associated protein Cas1, partial [sediment metagenome]